MNPTCPECGKATWLADDSYYHCADHGRTNARSVAPTPEIPRERIEEAIDILFWNENPIKRQQLADAYQNGRLNDLAFKAVDLLARHLHTLHTEHAKEVASRDARISELERERDEAVMEERFGYKPGCGDTGEIVRYLCDDRSSGDGNELVIMQGGNGDWYVGVMPEGEHQVRSFVRICTSGGAQFAASGLGVAIAYAYRAIKMGAAWQSRNPQPETQP